MKRVIEVDDVQRAQIQALVRTGFSSLRAGDYWLLRIADAATAIASLQTLLLAHPVQPASAVRPRPDHLEEAVSIAFTHAGLTKLGIVESAQAPFPTAFRSGQASRIRAELLRDWPRDQWTWGDVEVPPNAGQPWFEVHVLVVHFRNATCRPLDLTDAAGFDVQRIVCDPDYFQELNGECVTREPFGFVDGIGQPFVEGLEDATATKNSERRELAGSLWDDRVVAPGEFVLGHLNEYGEAAYCPDIMTTASEKAKRHPPFGLNGSYLAVRQIRQLVKEYETYAKRKIPSAFGCPFAHLTIGEKMMGRTMDGKPLLWRPGQPAEDDAFRYLVDDAEGFQIPRGSHIRRANPRDGLAVDVESGVRTAKLHRLLRRGRSYVDQDSRGMMFIACNADLDRQFEFVQQRWIANPRFVGESEVSDPILGTGEAVNQSTAGSRNRRFNLPSLPVGTTLTDLPTFTSTVGAGYFFLPSLDALNRVLSLERFEMRPRDPR